MLSAGFEPVIPAINRLQTYALDPMAPWIVLICIFSPMTQQSLMGQGLRIDVDTRSHLDTPHLVESLWKGDQPVTETSTWQYTTSSTDRHPFPGGIRTYNPKGEQPQTQGIDRAATGNGLLCVTKLYFLTLRVQLIGHLETDAGTQTTRPNIKFDYRQPRIMISDLLRIHGQIIRKARTLKDIHIYGKLVLRHYLFIIRIFLNSDWVCTGHSVRQQARVFVSKLQMLLIFVYSEAVYCRDRHLAVHDASVPAMHFVWRFDPFEEWSSSKCRRILPSIITRYLPPLPTYKSKL
jgi:hypothetical protein